MKPWSPLLSLTLSWACSAPDTGLPALSVDTESAAIGVGLDYAIPLCGGDLLFIENQIKSSESRLRTKRDSPVTIYLVDDPPCVNPDFVGCYRPDQDTVYAHWKDLAHEVVHAVARDIDFPSLFWSEGTAEMVTGMRTQKSLQAKLTTDLIEAEELSNYVSASHFARFLVETRGWDAYNQAIRGIALEEVYGESAAELSASYEENAPYSYPEMNPCPYPAIPNVESGVWRENLEFSCDSAEATQFESVTGSRSQTAAVHRTIELELGQYAIEMSGGAEFLVLQCQIGELAEPVEDPFEYDVRIQGYGLPNRFAANEEHIVNVSAGVYRLSIVSETPELASLELSVTKL